MSDETFMREAIALARANVEAGGRPFGAVLVRDGRVLARGVNQIHETHDPSAHAELQAIRQASQALGSLLGVTVAFAGGLSVYGLMKALLGIRLSQEEEYYGADLSIHKIGAISHE